MENINYSKKNKIIHMTLFIFSIICCFYLAELSRLFIPFFKTLYYGNITNMLVDVLRMICYILITIFAYRYGEKHFSLGLQTKRLKDLPVKRILILYAITIGVIFVVSAFLKFELKLVYDLGENLGAIFLFGHLASILASVLRMPIILLIIRYAQELFELILQKDYSKYIPFGGIISLLAIGIFELAIHGFEPVYVIFLFMHILYYYIYLLSYKQYALSLTICIMINIL